MYESNYAQGAPLQNYTTYTTSYTYQANQALQEINALAQKYLSAPDIDRAIIALQNIKATKEQTNRILSNTTSYNRAW